MDIKLHKQATITPKIRVAIQREYSNITYSELARQNSVLSATTWRWRPAAKPHAGTGNRRSNATLGCNHHISQKALHHQSSITAMKEWQAKRSELFTKRVVKNTGPNIYFKIHSLRLQTYSSELDSFRAEVNKCEGKKSEIVV